MNTPIRSHIALTVTALAVSLAGLANFSFAQDKEPEDFPSLVKRLQQAKPEFAKRHQDLLAQRYDLTDRPAKEAAMSRGKPVQEGIRVKLPKGMTWEKLAAMKPEEIKTKDVWPAGFF